MQTIYHDLARLMEQKERVAVATVVEVKGSVPGEVGAKMVIRENGQHIGTIGGGCGEGDVIEAGLEVIQTGRPRTVAVDLTGDISILSQGVCGGIMNVFVQPWPEGPSSDG